MQDQSCAHTLKVQAHMRLLGQKRVSANDVRVPVCAPPPPSNHRNPAPAPTTNESISYPQGKRNVRVGEMGMHPLVRGAPYAYVCMCE